MSVMVLQVFVSLMLVACSVAFFVFVVRSRTFEHADRLSLAPLDDDTGSTPSTPPAGKAAEPSPHPTAPGAP